MSELQRRYELLHGGDTEAMRAEIARLEQSGREVVIVSACLLGVRCRYDGNDKRDDDAVARVAGAGVEILPLCPEVLARLGVPRPAITLSADGKLATDARGRDVTAELEAGVRLADLVARESGATRALLKERSPSCGVTEVHGPDGVRAGQGRFAARLSKRGLPIVSERAT
ncbi:MAG: hypothetical protein JWM53_2243 [bacterium]|nr:hypothetical protein [bacterium]